MPNDSFNYIFALSFGGALIQRAEIIPFEPDADSADEGTRVLNDLKYYSPFSWLLMVAAINGLCTLLLVSFHQR